MFWQKCAGKTDHIPSVASRLIYPVNSVVHKGTWGLSTLLGNRVCSNGCGTHFDGWKCMLLSPCIPSITAIMATFFVSPLHNDRSQERDWQVSIEQVILFTCFIEVSLLRSHTGQCFTTISSIFTFFCPIREVCPHTTYLFLTSNWLKVCEASVDKSEI